MAAPGCARLLLALATLALLAAPLASAEKTWDPATWGDYSSWGEGKDGSWDWSSWESKDGSKDGSTSAKSEKAADAGCIAEDALSEYNAPRTCISHGGLSRCWFTYLPSTMPASGAQLMVDLHGWGGCPLDEARGSGFLQAADQAGAAIAFAAASLVDGSPTWNAAAPGDDNKAGTVDDADFLVKLIEHEVASRSAVDGARVYLVGYSNGCMMAQYFALTRASHVTAVGCYAGNLLDRPAQAPDDYLPTPIMKVHGSNDDVVALETANIAAWAGYNGCRDYQATAQPDGSTRHLHSNCSLAPNGISADAELLEVPNVGHMPFSQQRSSDLVGLLQRYSGTSVGSGRLAAVLAPSEVTYQQPSSSGNGRLVIDSPEEWVVVVVVCVVLTGVLGVLLVWVGGVLDLWRNMICGKASGDVVYGEEGGDKNGLDTEAGKGGSGEPGLRPT